MSRNRLLTDQLAEGKSVQYRPRGNSMTGIIKSGQLVTLDPVQLEDVKVGDTVLAKVKGKIYLHLVTQIAADGKLMISNNHGHDNGWTRTVFGKLVKVDD